MSERLLLWLTVTVVALLEFTVYARHPLDGLMLPLTLMLMVMFIRYHYVKRLEAMWLALLVGYLGDVLVSIEPLSYLLAALAAVGLLVALRDKFKLTPEANLFLFASAFTTGSVVLLAFGPSLYYWGWFIYMAKSLLLGGTVFVLVDFVYRKSVVQ